MSFNKMLTTTHTCLYLSTPVSFSIRINKEYAQKLLALAAQREKLEEGFKKESERLLARRGDLEKQLENLQEKFKVSLLDNVFMITYISIYISLSNCL